MVVFLSILLIGLVMWFFYTKKKEGLNPNEALKEVFNGKPQDKARIIEKLEAKKAALNTEAEQAEKIKSLKGEIAQTKERIAKAKE